MVSTAATLSQALFTYGPRFEPRSDLLLPWLIFVGMRLETHFHIGDPDVMDRVTLPRLEPGPVGEKDLIKGISSANH